MILKIYFIQNMFFKYINNYYNMIKMFKIIIIYYLIIHDVLIPIILHLDLNILKNIIQI